MATSSDVDGRAHRDGQQARRASTASVRVLSIVEALTVTGPVKPLLMFSPLARRGIADYPRISQSLLTTRRGALHVRDDELQIAAAAAGVGCRFVAERRAFDPGVLRSLAREIRDFAPDIIETHDCKSHFLLHLVRLQHRDIGSMSWIAFHHGYTRTSWKIAVYQQLDRLTLRHAQHVVTVCRPFAQMLATRGVMRERLSVISNPVTVLPRCDAEVTQRLRRELGIDPDELVVLSVGRLSVEKGHDYLIRAFAAASARAPGARLRLVLVGDGPERERLEGLSADLGARVLLVGYQSDPRPFYGIADIFVLSSLSEGSPLVLLEAMAAELPIVATAVGGIPEMLQDRITGVVVPGADHEGLANAVISLASDRSLRDRLAHAALRAAADCSPEAYGARLLSIYSRVLANG